MPNKKEMQRIPHINVFIGWDERQTLAYQVCRKSLLQHASRPLTIYPLKHRTLRNIGLFTREWSIKKDGNTSDNLDTRPFSTNFAFTRFLVPHYTRYLGAKSGDISIFVDSDFVFMRDVYSILNEVDITSKPLWVVKHDYKSPHVIKMDNQVQTNYNKKLWSSFMVFNMADPLCGPTIKDVNTKDGSWLHSFGWLKDEEMIGSLHEGWNYIPEHSDPRVPEREMRAIHYTEGTPLMKPGCQYAEVFNSVLRDVLTEALNKPEVLE